MLGVYLWLLTFAQDSLNQAAQEMQLAHFAQATAILQKHLAENPQDVAGWNLLGIAEGEVKDEKAAADAFHHGLRLQPTNTTLNENLGLLLFRSRDYRAAKTYLRKGSGSAPVRFSLAAAELRSGEAARARAELAALEPALSSQGAYWLERGRADLPVAPAQAEEELTRAAQISEQPAEAWDEAARAAEAQGEEEKALSYLIKARTADPRNVSVLLHFGALCIRRDLGPDAIAALTEAVQLEPRNAEAVFLLARAQMSVQDWDSALARFNDFLQLRPDFAPGYYARAWVRLRLNQNEEALHDLDSAISRAPGYSDARCERAQLELGSGSTSAAKRDVEAALHSDRRNARALVLAGDLAAAEDRRADAATRYREAIQIKPDLTAAHYKLAGVMARMGDQPGAAEERAIASRLAAAEKQSAHTQLRLVLPDSLAAH